MATKAKAKTSSVRTVRAKKNAPVPASLKNSIDAIAKDPAAVSKQEAINALQRISGLLKKTGPLKAPSTNFSSELNNIDFQKMIGGPLQACVNAQVASSLATVDFINSVGFAEVNGKKELVMVDFSHTRNDVKADGTADKKEINIKVPLLAMLPIPSLRIEHVIIDFNVKLNSVETSKVDETIGVNAEVSGGWGPVHFKVSASYQRKSTTGVEVRKEYALNVNVKAVQDEIPAGLEKILNMLAA
ncbi:MAG: DUF2589 domain-containing protein [Ferruginibacter sp.]